MIEQKTVVDKIEILRDGVMQIRLALLFVENQVELSATYHRAIIVPGDDPDAKFAEVNASLSEMKRATINGGEVHRVKSIVFTIHSPEIVQSYKDKQAEILAQIPQPAPDPKGTP